MDSTRLVLPAGPAPGADARADADPVADDPDAQLAFTSELDAVEGRPARRSHLQLTGLWCAGCATTIERALEAEPGVLRARVAYGTQRATVSWQPHATSVSRLVAAVAHAGYGAAPDVAAPARTLRQAEARRMLWRLFVAGFCMMQIMMYQTPLYVAAPGTLAPDLRALLLWAAWLLAIPVVVFSAAPLFQDAWRGLKQRRIAMDLPVSIGIAVMFVASTGATFDPGGVFGRDAYFDSLAMFVTFLLVGRWLTLALRNRVAATLEEAIARTPAALRRIEADGSIALIAPQRLRRGDRLSVLAGEAFAADGPIESGETDVDEALLTGESRPVAKRPGDVAIAGSINLGAVVVQRADRVGADTRYDGIVRMMRGALSDRPATLRAADRIAGPFLWIVLLLAAGAAAAWSIVDPSRAVWVAVSVLIVTCPCALSLAAPSALLAAAGALSKRGVLVRRLDAIESLAGIDTVCFDKTGTLTEPSLRRAEVEPQHGARRAGLDAAALLAMASSLARLSTHPMARALADARGASGPDTPTAWHAVREHAGLGLEAIGVDGGRYRLGAQHWIAGADETVTGATAGAETWFSGPSGALARFRFGETLRSDAAASIDALRHAGLTVELLSGDAPERVRAVADTLGIARALGAASPADKLAAVARLQTGGHRVAMVGDGLNDAPVMACADVSFAMGQGLSLTRSTADFALMSGSLADIGWARDTARRTMRIVRQNMAWAVAYNAVCLPLALFGWFPPWVAGLGMAASSLVVVANAWRIA